jgi:hypothetical protein
MGVIEKAKDLAGCRILAVFARVRFLFFNILG